MAMGSASLGRLKPPDGGSKALLIVKDDVVAHQSRSEEPNIECMEQKSKPLGPLQELDNVVLKVIGTF